jgi:hypothetical protein
LVVARGPGAPPPVPDPQAPAGDALAEPALARDTVEEENAAVGRAGGQGSSEDTPATGTTSREGVLVVQLPPEDVLVTDSSTVPDSSLLEQPHQEAGEAETGTADSAAADSAAVDGAAVDGAATGNAAAAGSAVAASGVPALDGGQWSGVLAKFVDDPRGSVADAAALVDEAITVFVAQARDREARLGSSWRDNDADTEELRTVLQQYRVFWKAVAEPLPSA